MINTTAHVTLATADVNYAFDIAKWRTTFALMAKLTDRAAGQIDGCAKHLNGALAEVAVARYLGVPLPAVGAYTFHDQPDLPPDIEVRWRSKPSYELIIRDNDRHDRTFVLVTGHAPTLTIRGWYRGPLRYEWQHDHGGYGPAWFVPSAELAPPETLKAAAA